MENSGTDHDQRPLIREAATSDLDGILIPGLPAPPISTPSTATVKKSSSGNGSCGSSVYKTALSHISSHRASTSIQGTPPQTSGNERNVELISQEPFILTILDRHGHELAAMPAYRRRSLWRSSLEIADQGIHSLEEAFEQLDVHALKFVFLTRSWSLRIIWLILFCIGCLAAGYYVRQIVIDFQSHQTATKISTKIEEDYDYPPIYICPRYNWDLEKANEHNLSMDSVVHAASLSQRNDTHRPLPSLETETFIADHRLNEFIRKSSHMKRLTYSEFYKWIALDPKKIIQESAGIQSTDFSSIFVANPNFDTRRVSYRACYNVSAGKYNPHMGKVFYLQYSIDKANDSSRSLGSESDFAFIKDDHRVVLEKDRIYLRTNRVTTIRLSVKEFSRRVSKENWCKRPEESDKYSQEFCRYQCFADAIDKCSRCKMMFEDTELIGSNLLCTGATNPNLTINCEETQDGSTYKKCLSSCLPLCEYKSYDFSFAAVVINTSHYLDPRIGLSIYFLVDDGILLYEEIPIYNLQTLISNIGGQMGLWTGASILTAIELIYLLTQFVCANWDWKKEERRRRRPESVKPVSPIPLEDGNANGEYEPVPTVEPENEEDMEKGPEEDGDKIEEKQDTVEIEETKDDNINDNEEQKQEEEENEESKSQRQSPVIEEIDKEVQSPTIEKPKTSPTTEEVASSEIPIGKQSQTIETASNDKPKMYPTKEEAIIQKPAKSPTEEATIKKPKISRTAEAASSEKPTEKASSAKPEKSPSKEEATTEKQSSKPERQSTTNPNEEVVKKQPPKVEEVIINETKE